VLTRESALLIVVALVVLLDNIFISSFRESLDELSCLPLQAARRILFSLSHFFLFFILCLLFNSLVL